MKVYQHNVEAYAKVKIAFKTSKRTCVVQPTGTGKSYVALQLIEATKGKKILYITSYGANARQFATLVNREVGACNIDYKLYASSNDVQSIYDIIILDEFHRVGAKQWGKYVDNILEKNKNAYVLGLSATPIRYLDDKRDMADEIFYGSIASEMTLAEAIGRRIIRQPKYITCLYSLENEYNSVLKLVANMKSKEEIEKANELLKKAKTYLENSKGLEEVFKESIDNKSGRYIVFCRDLEHLEKMHNESNAWFRGVNNSLHKYKIARDMSKGEIINELRTFERDDTKALKLLFCINMLNEGYHLESIDGVILLRATTSPNVYLQQIGRAISANTNNTPLIIDVVNNASCLRLTEDLENGVNRVLSASSGNKEFKRKFSIIAFEKEFTDILDKIKSIRSAECTDHLGNKFNNILDMCKYWGVARNTYDHRIKSGWSKKDALETQTEKFCTDHIGNKFASITDMCKHWGIARTTYDSRIKLGWSKKDALETPSRETDIESCTDHLGNKFNSIADMCKHWGIIKSTYDNRIKLGWSKKDALETPIKELDIESSTDHLGNKFNSIEDMCKHWGITRNAYDGRIRLGWSKKDALETPIKELDIESSTDHLGNKFKNIADMCKHWGITKSAYDHRIKSGWSKKDALETPQIQNGKQCTDHLGNQFNTIADMLKYWGISKSTYDYRIKLGWSQKDALETPQIQRDKQCTDHLGNKFNSIVDMCKHWGISKSTYDGRVKLGWSKKDALETPTEKFYTDHLGNKFNSITAMCKHWGISRATYDKRIKSGWSKKDALTIPPGYKK